MEVFFGHFLIDKAVGKGAAQGLGQPEDQDGAGKNGCGGQEKGLPEAEQHRARSGGDIAGDGGHEDGKQLDHKEEQLRIGKNA